MDGYTLKRKLTELINETSSGSFMNDRTTYDYLYDAVQDFIYRTHYMTGNQTISIVAGTSEYNLPADYVGLSLVDSYNRPYVKHTYNGNDSFIFNAVYDEVVLSNSTAAATVAQSYSITDASQISNFTGTATSAGASSNGECTLTDSNANFSTVAPGDYVHNTTSSTDGIVTALTSSTQIVCALFTDGASGAGFSQNDAYIIVPQPRYKIVLSPIPSATATLTVPYIKRPDPVYSPYRAYRLPFNYSLPIVQFAAFLYKYKDREPNYADALYRYYDGFVRKAATEISKSTPDRQGFRVNLSKLNGRSKTIGNYSR